jgi:hypothetical protein
MNCAYPGCGESADYPRLRDDRCAFHSIDPNKDRARVQQEFATRAANGGEMTGWILLDEITTAFSGARIRNCEFLASVTCDVWMNSIIQSTEFKEHVRVVHHVRGTSLGRVSFSSEISFAGCAFDGSSASFENVDFQRRADFTHARVEVPPKMLTIRFEDGCDFSSVSVGGSLKFEDVVFGPN